VRDQREVRNVHERVQCSRCERGREERKEIVRVHLREKETQCTEVAGNDPV